MAKIMGLTYLKKSDYNKHKDMFIKQKLNFNEIRTSNRRFLQLDKTKFYLSNNPVLDMQTKLLNHELGMIKNIKDYAIKKYLENRYSYKDRIDEKLYIGSNFDLFENFESDDIYEIDITAAYPTTAKLMGLMSENNFDKFFEKETNVAHIARKFNIRKVHKDNSYFSGDIVLKYSKKCRLISLGSLATKKEIDIYNSGELVQTDYKYDREIANIFYSIAYETGKKMFEITEKYSNVYFWWVDAIFCKEIVKDEIVDEFKKLGYNVKVKKCCKINFNRVNKQVNVYKNNLKDIHPYFFALNTDVEHIKDLISTENDALSMLDWYSNFLKYDNFALSKIINKAKELHGEKTTIEKVIFTDLCNNLKIETPNDMNLKYLMRVLKNRGLSYQDFIQIRSITTNAIRSSELDSIFNNDNVDYNADLVTLNVCLRAFNPLVEYNSDIQEKDVIHEKIGVSKTKIYQIYKLENLNIDSSEDEFDLKLNSGSQTIIEKFINI